MKFLKSNFCWITFVLIFACISASAQPMLKRNNLFDYNWRFHKGGALGAEELSFDDSGWRLIDLPHDWSIEDLPGTNSPFNADAISQVNGGFTTGGTGWYRKTFTIPKELINKEFIIMFEGVYMNSDVWLNGEFLGNHPYGYTSFWFDISGKIRFDKENVLAVKVKNEGENSRWYSGSGIYRHVWLNIVAPVYFEQWGTCITTPQVTHEEAIINIKTALVNKTRKAAAITFVTKIFNSSGEEKAEIKTYKTIDSGSTSEIVGELKLNRPSLWSPDSPELYKAISEIYDSETLVDKVETTFGIRTISFDASRGFLLNGKPMKLKGGCVHHDNGILGSKAYDRAEERRVELLKSNGFNAIRFS